MARNIERDARHMAEVLADLNLEGLIALDWPAWSNALRYSGIAFLRRAANDERGTDDEQANVKAELARRTRSR